MVWRVEWDRGLHPVDSDRAVAQGSHVLADVLPKRRHAIEIETLFRQFVPEAGQDKLRHGKHQIDLPG